MPNRIAIAGAATAILALTLSACAADEPAQETAAVTQTATVTAEATAQPELNCSSVVADYRFTWVDADPTWGLRTQSAVTDDEMTLKVTGFEPPAPTQTLPVTRAVYCAAGGQSRSAGQHWTYAEFDSSEQATVDAWVESLGDLPWQDAPNGGRQVVLSEEDLGTASEGWLPFAVIGEGWLSIGYGTMSALSPGAFSGELREVDSNEALPREAASLDCSMFFAPMSGGQAAPYAARESLLASLNYPKGESAPFTPEWRNEPGHYGDLSCEGLTWYDRSEQTDQIAFDQPPIFEHDGCRLYELRDTNPPYVAVCPEGWVEITGDLEVAKLVVNPAFRGLQ